jgi:hypothetical protein
MASKGRRVTARRTADHSRLPAMLTNKPRERSHPTRLYLDTHPLHDYEPLRKLGTAWLGTPRNGSHHSIVTVDRIHNASLSSLSQFSRLCHGNLVTPVAFYSVSDDAYVVHEYQGESLFDLRLLPVQNATSMVFQVRSIAQVPIRISILPFARSLMQSTTSSGPEWRFAYGTCAQPMRARPS